MRLRDITMAGLVLLMLAFVISPVNAANATDDMNASDAAVADGDEDQLVDDIPPYEGMVGPDSVLYRLGLALDDLDIAFTFNESEKIGKQISSARHRLAEIKYALNKRNLEAAETAIEQYEEDTLNAEESISRIKNKDTGLFEDQLRIAINSYVLERLIDSHPDNAGLLRAYNKSERLLVKFVTKTSVKLERKTDKMGRKVLRHVRVDDDESDGYEKTSLKASVGDNKTHVKVELKFVTNSTEDAEIAGDILERIDAVESDISSIIKIERDDEADDSEDDDEEDESDVTVTGGPTKTLTTPARIRTETLSREKIKAEAEVKGNTTRVNFEYSFFLNETGNSAIISSINAKLSALTIEKVLNSLDVKVKEIEKEDTKRKKVEIEDSKRENSKGNDR